MDLLSDDIEICGVSGYSMYVCLYVHMSKQNVVTLKLCFIINNYQFVWAMAVAFTIYNYIQNIQKPSCQVWCLSLK